MSTRCTIHIEQKDGTSKIYYHHHDGYLSGVGEALWSMGKRKRSGGNSEIKVMKAIAERFGRPYKLVSYDSNEERVSGYSYLEFVKEDPADIEWRYHIKLDGVLIAEKIHSKEVFKIANRKHFDFLVQHTEKQDAYTQRMLK